MVTVLRCIFNSQDAVINPEDDFSFYTIISVILPVEQPVVIEQTDSVTDSDACISFVVCSLYLSHASERDDGVTSYGCHSKHRRIVELLILWRK